MDKKEMKKRTMLFGSEIIKLCGTLKHNRASSIIAHQLLRSGTSVGANYRAACVAKSYSDFIAKMCIVAEEADESVYWLELLVNTGIKNNEEVAQLINEGNQILAISLSTIKSCRNNLTKDGN